MATTTKTTHIYTCDLCGEERGRDELTKLGWLDTAPGYPGGRPVMADVCGACQDRPVRDVIAFLGKQEAGNG